MQQQQSTPSASGEAAAADTTEAETQPVQLYIAALARYVSAHYNDAAKPRAPWQLLHDVEADVISAEALRNAVHYLQHHAFGTSNTQRTPPAAEQNASAPPVDYEAKCATRELELTLEAVEALLAGRHIAEIHRVAAAEEEVGSASTTAAMVPPAEAAAFYIHEVVRISAAPLQGTGSSTNAPPSPFTALPPARQQYWAQTAQQLTTVLYLALLVTNTNTTDAQLVGQAFRDAVRGAYGVPTGRFGVVRSAHYIVHVALPYVQRSFSTILDVMKAQQAQAAKEAAAAAEAGIDAKAAAAAAAQQPAPPRAATTAGKASTATGGTGGGSGGKSGGGGAMSDKMNKLTLVVICLAAALYMASAGADGILTDGSKRTALMEAEAAEEKKEMQQAQQRLSALAASVTAATEVGKR